MLEAALYYILCWIRVQIRLRNRNRNALRFRFRLTPKVAVPVPAPIPQNRPLQAEVLKKLMSSNCELDIVMHWMRLQCYLYQNVTKIIITRL
jgi:hypothetical protein